MKTNREAAIVVGELFIAATVLSLIGSTLIGSVIGSPLTGTGAGVANYLANASAQAEPNDPRGAS
jgi:hypothetical protein